LYFSSRLCYYTKVGIIQSVIEFEVEGVKTVIVTAKALYKAGRIIFYDGEEVPEEGTEVIVNFERRLKTSIFSMRDSWAEYFPKEIDLDGQLKSIRKEWEQEMEEISE
jgi:hypothetical protein